MRISASRRAQSRSTRTRSPTAGGSSVAGLELVDDLAVDLARRADGPRPAVGGPQEEAAVRRLPAAARIEDGPVEDDQRPRRPSRPRRPAPRRAARRRRCSRAARRSGSCRARSLGRERPDHRRMDGADEGVGAGVERPGRRRSRVSTPLKMSPLNTLGPVRVALVDRRRCAGRRHPCCRTRSGTACRPGPSTDVCSNLMPERADLRRCRTPTSLGAGRGRPALGVGVLDGAGRRSSRRGRMVQASDQRPRGQGATHGEARVTHGRWVLSCRGAADRDARARIYRARRLLSRSVRGGPAVRSSRLVPEGSHPVPSGRLLVRPGPDLVSLSTSHTSGVRPHRSSAGAYPS